jgi:putative transposase
MTNNLNSSSRSLPTCSLIVHNLVGLDSYSHKDETLRDKLETHLSLLKRQGYIASWHDRKIVAGQEWADEIDENFKTADIILLLVSANFIPFGLDTPQLAADLPFGRGECYEFVNEPVSPQESFSTRVMMYACCSIIWFVLPRVCPATYRRVVFDAAADAVLKEVSLDLAERYEIVFLEIGTDGDHVPFLYFLVQAAPRYTPSKIVRLSKSLPAREILKPCPHVQQRQAKAVGWRVKQKLWGGEFWSDGYFIYFIYFIASVGQRGNWGKYVRYVREQGSPAHYQKLHEQQLALFALFDAPPHPPP